MVNTFRYIFIFLALALVAFGLSFGIWFGPAWVNEQRTDTVWLLCLTGAAVFMVAAFWMGNAKLSPKPNSDERLAHNSQRILTLVLVGFTMLGLQLLRNQIVIADQISKPYFTPTNELVQDPRTIRDQLKVERGRIFDTFGNQVAGIEVKNGLVKRTYQNRFVNPLIGYYSPLQFGNTGLESKYDDYLTGSSGTNPFAALTRDLLHQPVVGNDLYLSIVPEYQELAQKELGDQDGAIVLMDAKSGEVLAMVGNPQFDPSQLAFDPTIDDSLWDAQTKEIQKRWDALNKDPRQLLLYRPTQGRYTPGSTFKTLTLAALLDIGKTSPDQIWKDEGKLTVDGATFLDNNRPDRTKTDWTTTEGYMFSLNAVFGQMGLALGGADLERYMNRYGFNEAIPFDVPTLPSLPYLTKGFLNGRAAQASSGFGQGEILVTPLHWAMLAASFARDDGSVPKPILVKEIRAHDKSLIKAAKPEIWKSPINPQTASTVRDIMIQSATKGYVGINGGGLAGSGAVVGGKTGTAEVDTQKVLNNAWYIGWAKKGDRAFAIAVVVDHKVRGEGLSDAMPKANNIMRRVLAGVK